MTQKKLFSMAVRLKAKMPELQEFSTEDFIPLAFNLSLPKSKRLKHLQSIIGNPNKEIFRSDEIPLLRYYYKEWERIGRPKLPGYN